MKKSNRNKKIENSLKNLLYLLKKEVFANNTVQTTISLKDDWQDIKRLMDENGIHVFYHLTSKKNIDSIQNNDGLYSRQYCDDNGLIIPQPGGDQLSRNLDRRRNLQDYVRLSFSTKNPMFYGREDIYVLEISREVALYKDTLFSNINAADSRAAIGYNYDMFRKIGFDIIKRRYWNNTYEKKAMMAEVMVKEYVPSYLINKIYPWRG